MTNQITMGTREAIISLYRAGVKKRRIARRLGIDIKTVRAYLKSADSVSPISPAGSEAATSPISPAGKPFDKAQGRAGRPSTCAPFKSQIEEAIRQGLCGQRIYQDLKTDCGYSGSYDAVKRFLRRLIPASERIWRMETQPGEEAQVDFGKGARIRSADGKTHGSWVFRIVLSFSRKAYSEAVFHQCTEVFIRCLENAFRALGGVPATVVIDNLKAAVKHADWYDPELILQRCSSCITAAQVTRRSRSHTTSRKRGI